jgi:elongation factor Ts
MTVKAADVNKLRQITGAGMMDCKKALQESNGDIEEAVTYLRKKGQKVSEKRAEKEATEGGVFAATTPDNTKGVLIKISCETDFVAKNKDYVALGEKIAKAAIENQPEDLESLKNTRINGNSIDDLLKDEMAKIGEKIEISEFAILEGDCVIPYIHAGNKIGVLTGLNKPYSESIEKAGRDVAMQIAAMSPVAVNESGIPQKMLDTEKAVIKDQIQQEGKPENIAEKIAEGKLKKFFKERTLIHQEFVKDPSLTVDKYLKGIDNQLTVTGFKRVAIEV